MKLRLATPGPTEVPQRLLLAGAREIIHHRSTEMEQLIHEISGGLPPLFGTGAPVYTSWERTWGSAAANSACTPAANVSTSAAVTSPSTTPTGHCSAPPLGSAVDTRR